MNTQIKTDRQIAREVANRRAARYATQAERVRAAVIAHDSALAAIEADRAQRVSERSITINLDTGEWLSDTRITGEEGARVAASVLPGVTPEQVSGWYSEWLSKW